MNTEWNALASVVPANQLKGWMFMGCTASTLGEPIYMYKHGITRRYLNLTSDSRAWSYVVDQPSEPIDDGHYDEIPLEEAIAHATGELDEGLFGDATKDTAYDAAYQQRRAKAFADAGYTVVSVNPTTGESMFVGSPVRQRYPNLN